MQNYSDITDEELMIILNLFSGNEKLSFVFFWREVKSKLKDSEIDKNRAEKIRDYLSENGFLQSGNNEFISRHQMGLNFYRS